MTSLKQIVSKKKKELDKLIPIESAIDIAIRDNINSKQQTQTL